MKSWILLSVDFVSSKRLPSAFIVSKSDKSLFIKLFLKLWAISRI